MGIYMGIYHNRYEIPV